MTSLGCQNEVAFHCHPFLFLLVPGEFLIYKKCLGLPSGEKIKKSQPTQVQFNFILQMKVQNKFFPHRKVQNKFLPHRKVQNKFKLQGGGPPRSHLIPP